MWTPELNGRGEKIKYPRLNKQRRFYKVIMIQRIQIVTLLKDSVKEKKNFSSFEKKKQIDENLNKELKAIIKINLIAN